MKFKPTYSWLYWIQAITLLCCIHCTSLFSCDQECVKQYCMYQIVEADNKMDAGVDSDEYYYQKGKRDAFQEVLNEINLRFHKV